MYLRVGAFVRWRGDVCSMCGCVLVCLCLCVWVFVRLRVCAFVCCVLVCCVCANPLSGFHAAHRIHGYPSQEQAVDCASLVRVFQLQGLHGKFWNCGFGLNPKPKNSGDARQPLLASCAPARALAFSWRLIVLPAFLPWLFTGHS